MEIQELAEEDTKMGNNVTPDFLRGFIIPMELGSANIWQSETTITQQNPSAGDPVPQQTSKMRVLSNGVQSDTGIFPLLRVKREALALVQGSLSRKMYHRLRWNMAVIRTMRYQVLSTN